MLAWWARRRVRARSCLRSWRRLISLEGDVDRSRVRRAWARWGLFHLRCQRGKLIAGLRMQRQQMAVWKSWRKQRVMCSRLQCLCDGWPLRAEGHQTSPSSHEKHQRPPGTTTNRTIRVRFQIIGNARIENVGRSQSCMVSKLRIVWKQTIDFDGLAGPPVSGASALPSKPGARSQTVSAIAANSSPTGAFPYNP